MSDPEDGAGRDGPSDDPADEDPFVYPSDEERDDEPTGVGEPAGGDESGDADDADEVDADDAKTADADTDTAGDAPGVGTSPGRAEEARTDDARPDPTATAAARTDADSTPADRTGADPTTADQSEPKTSAGGSRSDSGETEGALKRFWTADSGAALYARDVLTSVAAVLLIGMLLFAVSGIWPPMVAVESESMEPNMNVGDLVFVVDNERFVPGEAVEHDGQQTGVVPADRAASADRTKFGEHGDVIIFMPDGNDRATPVIHRAMLFVEEDEDWYDRADEDHVGSAGDCDELNNCPAPHAGFVTLGDNNARYDQQTTLTTPIRPEWIIGTAEVKVPYLGHVRLAFSGQVAVPLDSATALHDDPMTDQTAVGSAGQTSGPTATPDHSGTGLPAHPGAGTAHPVA